MANRRRIVEHVGEHPGIHLRQVARDLGLAVGTVEHHLHLLVRHGLVERHRFQREACLFLPGAHGSEGDRALLAAVRRPATRLVLRALLAEADPDAAALARRVGVSGAAIAHHLQRMERAGLVERLRVGRATLLRASRPEVLQRALARHDRQGPVVPWPGPLDDAHRRSGRAAPVRRGRNDRPTSAQASSSHAISADQPPAAVRSSSA